jgi:hypothetical protein
MPRVDFQLKLALTSVAPRPSARTGARPGQALLSSAVRLIAQPISAAYQNHFNYDVQGSSELSLSIVPVPPPQATAESTLPPRLTAEDARDAALKARGARFSAPRGEPAPGLRLEVNFNPLSREWFVLQYDPKAPTEKPVVAAVDDATGSVRVIRS